MGFSRVLLSLALCAATIQAGPLNERQVSASASSASTTPTGGALVETTIGGKVTTVTLPVGADASATFTTGTNTATKTSNSAATGTVSEGAPGVPDDTALSCHNDSGQPICQPHENQVLIVGNTYWIQWSSTAFPANTSITVGLQYTNDTSRVAWLSNQYVTQRGYTTVTIDKQWLEDWPAKNFSLVWNTFSADSSARKIAFNIELQQKPVEHLPAPPKSKMPDKQSLLIALPVTLGVLLLVLFGLCFGMRSHRKIGVGSVMGRGRHGYGAGKSRRQRMGIKKGAIHLEDREILPAADEYRDDDYIRPAAPPKLSGWPTPPQSRQGHDRDLSLGSLVTDDESNSNTFRQEVKNQQFEKR